MRGRRITYIMVAVWTVLVAVLAAADCVERAQERMTASYLDGCAVEDRYFLIENTKDDGILYVTDLQGKAYSVTRSSAVWKGSEFCRVASGDGVFALLRQTVRAEGETGARYRIVQFDENGKAYAMTPELLIGQEGILTGFAADGQDFYLTVVMDAGAKAAAYTVERSALQELPIPKEEKEAEKALALRMTDMTVCEEGRLIVEARYEKEGFALRKDDGSRADAFIDDPQLQWAFAGRSLTLGQWAKLSWERIALYAQLLIVGYVVLVLLFAAIRNRNHTIYTIAIVELVLLAITLAGSVQAPLIQAQAREDEARRFGYYYLETIADEMGDPHQYGFEDEEFYTDAKYYTLRNHLSRFADMGEVSDVFTDICLVRSSDGMILVSAAGHNKEGFSQLYAARTRELLDEMASGSRRDSMMIGIGRDRYQVFGMAASDELHPEYLLIGVARQDSAGILSGEIPRDYLIYAELAFLFGSLLSIALLLWQDRELRRLAGAMRDVAEGKKELVKGTVHGKDINLMWNSLMEIDKIISRINYTRYRIYESCYRFAPKNIEKILRKDSITEVKGGDMALLHGTIAVLSSTDPEESEPDTADKMDRFIARVEKYQEQSDGFFVTGQCDLAMMRLLFLEESRNTVESGAVFLHEFYEDELLGSLKTGIFLHYSQYAYGVAGTETQSFPFLLSKEGRDMENCARWLQSMGIRLVLTQSVRDRETIGGALRYIGYICVCGTQEQIRLYEALDAYSGYESRLKQMTDDKFQRALELFYQHDFYLARSTFSDVLKENPEDLIAKWYLFTCEKYLNETHLEGDICCLNWND